MKDEPHSARRNGGGDQLKPASPERVPVETKAPFIASILYFQDISPVKSGAVLVKNVQSSGYFYDASCQHIGIIINKKKNGPCNIFSRP